MTRGLSVPRRWFCASYSACELAKSRKAFLNGWLDSESAKEVI
jgi:hypothetical protein